VNHPSPLPDPAADLAGSLQQTLADLAEVLQRLPGASPAEAGRAEGILTRLAEELAEAAAITRKLPGLPAGHPGHTFAAVAALATAQSREHDFAGWLASVLCTVAARAGSSAALVTGRPGSWEAGLVLQLVQGTVGPADEDLARYAE